MKIEKKYIIISIVSVLILVIGFSAAFFTSRIVGSGKQILISTKELNIIFTDETEIKPEGNVNPGWSKTKSFSVQSKIKGSFYYNIVVENLVNTTVSNTLVYKINCTSGCEYTMDEYKPFPKSGKAKTVALLKNIEIPEGVTQEYTIEIKYLKTDEIDQTDDAGESFSGRLGITKYEKTLADKLIDNYELKPTRDSFENVLPSNANVASYDEKTDTESGLYKETNTLFTEDTDGDGIGNDVYYFAGNVTNNWSYFAGYYWRIIRTNEDGGIRLLFAGDASDTESGYISLKEFNSDYDNPRYVGLKYGESGNLVNNRANTYNSTILGNDDGTDEGSLNWWYVNKILNGSDGTYSYDKYVSKTAIYCNDRTVDPDSEYSVEYYFEYLTNYRLYDNKRPSFKCGVNASGEVAEGTQAIADKFSSNDASGGNGQLKYPVGLMTADEMAYAGGVYGKNNKKAYYYLNSKGTSVVGSKTWLLASPRSLEGSAAYVFGVFGSPMPGNSAGNVVYNTGGVRPVISIKSCATIKSGDGTSDAPYEFSIDSSCANAVN